MYSLIKRVGSPVPTSDENTKSSVLELQLMTAGELSTQEVENLIVTALIYGNLKAYNTLEARFPALSQRVLAEQIESDKVDETLLATLQSLGRTSFSEATPENIAEARKRAEQGKKSVLIRSEYDLGEVTFVSVEPDKTSSAKETTKKTFKKLSGSS